MKQYKTSVCVGYIICVYKDNNQTFDFLLLIFLFFATQNSVKELLQVIII